MPARIIIIGNGGTGKTTLARRIAAVRGHSPVHLDGYYFEPDRINVPRDPQVCRQLLDGATPVDGRWVAEGVYGQLADHLLARAHLLIWLCFPTDLCLQRNRDRPWEADKFASPEEQRRHEPALLKWVADYDHRQDDCSRFFHQQLMDRAGDRGLKLDSPAGLELWQIRYL